MTLEGWLRNGWLETSDPELAVIHQLFQIVDRELHDAQIAGLSVDGRFKHSYDAALELCMIPLRASGYKVKKGTGHHKHGIDSLKLTLGTRWSQTADHLERCSRLRGQAVYEQIGVVSERDAAELLTLTIKLRADVLAWLRAEHPDFLPPGIA
jgi:hypothetical protein